MEKVGLQRARDPSTDGHPQKRFEIIPQGLIGGVGEEVTAEVLERISEEGRAGYLQDGRLPSQELACDQAGKLLDRGLGRQLGIADAPFEISDNLGRIKHGEGRDYLEGSRHGAPQGGVRYELGEQLLVLQKSIHELGGATRLQLQVGQNKPHQQEQEFLVDAYPVQFDFPLDRAGLAQLDELLVDVLDQAWR